MHRARHLRPRGGFLRDGRGSRVAAVDHLVQPPQEGERFQVLPAPELVGHPLAGLARVVPVDHGGDRVHPQPVDVVALQPEHRVGDEEV